MLQYKEDQHGWNGLELPLAMQKVGKFGMNNPDIAVNVLFNSESGIHTARRSELNKKEASKLTYY